MSDDDHEKTDGGVNFRMAAGVVAVLVGFGVVMYALRPDLTEYNKARAAPTVSTPAHK